MTKRQWEILFSLALLLIALLFLLWMMRPAPEQTAPPQPPAPSALAPSGNAALPAPATPEAVAPLTPVQVDATNTARLFAERMGSYSTEANFANVDDVKVMATAAYALELERLAQNARREALPGTYYGVSTRVLGTTVSAQTATEATINVLTQREEVQGEATAAATVRNQNMVVRLALENNAWKIAGFAWEE
jgi:hypothetical protein